MERTKMKVWVKWLILGLLSVVFGVFVLANPVAASVSVTVLAGILFLMSGGVQVFAGFGEERLFGKVLGVGLGVLMLLLGLSLIWHPLEGVISLTLLVAIMFAASGVTRLITAFHMRETPFFWPMLLSGALSVLLAGYIFANFATVAPGLLGLLLGIELLFNGAGLIVLAFFLRTAKGAIKDKLEQRFNK
jgi:uncharacterized membrane protein HdeD (DUF308 family)